MKDTDKAREYFQDWADNPDNGDKLGNFGCITLHEYYLVELMQSFSNQQNAELIAENERLKKEAKCGDELMKRYIDSKNRLQELQSRYDQLVEGLRALQGYDECLSGWGGFSMDPNGDIFDSEWVKADHIEELLSQHEHPKPNEDEG